MSTTATPPDPVAATAAVPNTDDVVRQLLAPWKRNWHDVAAGSGISYSWITKFMQGRIPNAGSATLNTLRAWLEANPPPQANSSAPTPAPAADGISSQPGAASKPPA